MDVPVIGVGGVNRGLDAIEMLMAGASAVGVCTAAMMRGPEVFGKIAAEIDAWLGAHGYASVADVRDLALVSAEATWAAGHPEVEEAACNGCDLCVISCPYEAIEVEGKLAVIDLDRCARCGLCVTRCHHGAIAWSATAS